MTDHDLDVASPRTTPDPARWRVLALLGTAQLMLILDITVVTIALPAIGGDLGLERAALTWVVSAYTLAFGGLMLLGGRLADRFGSRRLVLTGLTIFTLASLATGLATGPALLLAGRVAQGVGAALLSPAALSAVVTTFDGEERNRALGVWSALSGGGAALGVLLGGLLTGGPGWPWIFFVNVPIGLVLLAALLRLLPAGPVGSDRRRLDLLGAALVTAATGAVLFALIGAGDRGWTDAATMLWLVAGLVLYAVFALWQRAADAPLMDLRLLVRRPVRAGTFLILAATALMIAVFFLGSFLLQRVHDLGPIATGLLFLPVAVATMAGSQLAGTFLGRTGARAMTLVAALVVAAGLALPACVGGVAAAVTGMAVGSAGIGALFVVASATALGQVAPHEAGIASGIVSTFHEFGAALGAAVISSVAAAGIAGGTVQGIEAGFGFAAVVAVVAGALVLALLPARRPTTSTDPGTDAAARTGEPGPSDGS
ncbi:MFS transporter [Cellulosimicrobium cellulans]|uniref:MFS transporter n=1 Tax=Cellulosimicrobium cellulans TaxID=1710 RepID=A0A1Y0I109_CELCE|nr:MFS transporter [Cellulosimicrobium cellulans]ARU53194.1 MFS transporter [Cellulosimicrobium cellulans]